ncbi:hypothetical protein MKX01_028249 [Papaver californicum]|nr:hypothetical protein MKX01_028249 [Papaver californicum]
MNTIVAEETCHLKENIQEESLEESSLTDLLLTAAEAEDWLLAFTVIESLQSRLTDGQNGENSFLKLAFFFTQGLQYKSFNKRTDRMSAFQMLQELRFAHLAANQAILEKTQGDPEVHVIDFNVMEGIQMPPLMVDLVSRKGASLRITAVVGDPTSMGYIRQTGKRLREFADSIYLPFRFEHIMLQKEEDYKGIDASNKLIANSMTHQLHRPYRNFESVKCFLNGIQILSFSKIPSMSIDFFCEAFHHYTSLYDSLVISFSNGYKVGLKLIEDNFLVGAVTRRAGKNVFSSLKGYKAIPMSYCNVSQAKYLVGLFTGCYWVQHEKCRLHLCWKSRPVISTTVWVPM